MKIKNTTGYVASKAVSSATRWRIVEALIQAGPLAVEEIARALDMTHSSVSHQLAVLAGRDVLKCEKDGRHMIYSFAKTAVAKTAVAIVRA